MLNKKSVIIIVSLVLIISGGVLTYYLVSKDKQINKKDYIKSIINNDENNNNIENNVKENPKETNDTKKESIEETSQNKDREEKKEKSKINKETEKSKNDNNNNNKSNNNSKEKNVNVTENNNENKKNSIQTNNDSNNKTQNSVNQSQSNNQITTEKTQEQKNNDFRNNLKNKYNVTVGYKDEIDGKYINSYANPTKLYDDEVIRYNLLKIENALNKYPNSFFSEIKNNWKPVSIYLVDNINGYAAGLVDNNNNNTIIILIVATHSSTSSILENTIHHEMMHVIDCYFTSKGIYSSYLLEQSMMQFNPEDFSYGTQSNRYVYLLDNPYYFISKYAKSNYKEDRAEIFANLMFRSNQPDCFKFENPVKEKAKIITKQINQNFNSAISGNNRWDRFVN